MQSVLALFREKVRVLEALRVLSPKAPCSSSMLDPIRHDMQEY
jgi:hypothetical protein